MTKFSKKLWAVLLSAAMAAGSMFGGFSGITAEAAEERQLSLLEDVIADAEFVKEYEGADQIFNGTRADSFSEYADELHSVTHGSIIIRFKVASDCPERGVLLGAKDSKLTPNTLLGQGEERSSLYIFRQQNYRFAFKHTVAALNGPYSFTDGNWHCVVLSSMPTGKSLRLTIDGTEMWSNSADVNRGLFGKQSVLDQVTIGGHLDANLNVVHGFKGSISQVIVTSQTLTDAQAIEISAQGYSGGVPSGTGLSAMFNNTSDLGDNTWVFAGGEAVQGTVEQIGGARNYIGHFEEYIRNEKSAGNDPTRQRYMINVAAAGQTLGDIVDQWEEKVTRFDPRAVAYMVGVEDYSKGSEGLNAFKANLKDFIDKALAEKANNGSFAMIQKPFITADAAKNANIELYSEAVDAVVAEYRSDATKYANIAVIDHTALSKETQNFAAAYLNEDGSLNEAGHLEIGRQLVLSTMGTTAQYPCRQGVRMGQTAVAQPAAYLDKMPTVTAGADSLNVQVPENSGTEWTYTLEIDEMTIQDTFTGTSAVIDELPEGKDYLLKLVNENNEQITTVEGTIQNGDVAVKDTNVSNENQQRLAELMAQDDSLTWLFVGDSITHGLVYTYGYGGTPQMFEKFLKDDLNRTEDVVINTAVSGAHTVSTLNNIEQRVEKYVPDVVAIMLGTNDAYPDVNNVDPGLPITTDQYEANMRTIIGKIRAVNPNAIIVLRCPAPMTSDDGRRANSLLNIERMKKLAAEDPTLIYVDQYTEMNEALTTYSWLANNDQLFLGNWLHPGINGQIVMAWELIEACGLWTEDSFVTNLYYESPMTRQNSSVAPALYASRDVIGISADTLAADSGMQTGSITIQATAKDDGRVYTTTAKASEEAAALRNLPTGTYDVIVSSYLKNTAKIVTFAPQEVTLSEDDQVALDFHLTNSEVTAFEAGEEAASLEAGAMSPDGSYEFTLCEGEGDDHNGYFRMDGARLINVKALTAGSVYKIRVKATVNGVSAEKTFTLTAYIDPADAGNDLPVDGMKLTAGSTEKTEGPLSALFDGDANSFYHSNWSDKSNLPTAEDFWITIELPEVTEISGMRYLPRQSSPNGRILSYEISYSLDGENWTVAKTGSWADDFSWKLAKFDENAEAKYVKIFAVDSKADAGGRHLTGAELRVLKADEKPEVPDVPVVPEKEVCEIFTDVAHGAWYEGAVQYVYDAGIMLGDSGAFSPDADTSRAMVAMILYRLEGSPKVTDYAKYNQFKDVAADAWYADAVAWALNEGLATGDSYNMLYNPNASVTREQLATFLYRYVAYTGEDVTVEGSFDDLFGGAYVNDWAKEGFAWALENGVIKGAEVIDGAGNISYDLAPQGTASRAQFATVLMRIM